MTHFVMKSGHFVDHPFGRNADSSPAVPTKSLEAVSDLAWLSLSRTGPAPTHDLDWFDLAQEAREDHPRVEHDWTGLAM